MELKTYKVTNIILEKQPDKLYYSKEVIQEMLDSKTVKELLNVNAMFVEFGNFDDSTVDLAKACAVAKKLYLNSDGLYADIKFLDSKLGKQAAAINDNLDLKMISMGEIAPDGKVIKCEFVKLCFIEK